MLEFSSDLVIVVDNDSKILQVNEHVPALLHYETGGSDRAPYSGN